MVNACIVLIPGVNYFNRGLQHERLEKGIFKLKKENFGVL